MNNTGSDNNKINFNREQLEHLKEMYNKAKDEGKETFWFLDREMYVPYAKYLIEYLETKLA